MNITQAIKSAIVNVMRYKTKTIINITISMVSIFLLLLSISINLAILEFVDNNLNNLNSEKVVRVFTLKYTTNEKNIDREQVQNEVLKTPHVDDVTFLSALEDEELVMKVTVDDYSNVLTVIGEYSTKERYKVFVEERNLVNIEIIRVVKVISIIILSIIIGLTYSTILINLKSFIRDRRYEIALYKALGYQKKDIVIILLLQSGIMVIISFILACIVALFTIHMFINPYINFENTVGIIESKVLIDFNTIIITLSICILLVFISSLSLVKKIARISPHMLLKSK